MKSQCVAVIESPVPSPVEQSTHDIEKRVPRPDDLRVDAIPLGLAWIFTSTVFVLMLVSLLLVVAGYVGSAFASDLRPKTISSSWAK